MTSIPDLVAALSEVLEDLSDRVDALPAAANPHVVKRWVGSLEVGDHFGAQISDWQQWLDCEITVIAWNATNNCYDVSTDRTVYQNGASVSTNTFAYEFHCYQTVDVVVVPTPTPS